jgi:hypothetical protein
MVQKANSQRAYEMSPATPASLTCRRGEARVKIHLSPPPPPPPLPSLSPSSSSSSSSSSFCGNPRRSLMQVQGATTHVLFGGVTQRGFDCVPANFGCYLCHGSRNGIFLLFLGLQADASTIGSRQLISYARDHIHESKFTATSHHPSCASPWPLHPSLVPRFVASAIVIRVSRISPAARPAQREEPARGSVLVFLFPSPPPNPSTTTERQDDCRCARRRRTPSNSRCLGRIIAGPPSHQRHSLASEPLSSHVTWGSPFEFLSPSERLCSVAGKLREPCAEQGVPSCLKW